MSLIGKDYVFTMSGETSQTTQTETVVLGDYIVEITRHFRIISTPTFTVFLLAGGSKTGKIWDNEGAIDRKDWIELYNKLKEAGVAELYDNVRNKIFYMQRQQKPG